MNRIRLEWSNLWAILGEHFNQVFYSPCEISLIDQGQVCCHNNPHVGFFALDALRQLAMRFLDKEELPHFKFQKDFLKPFEYTMIHNPNPAVRDMVRLAYVLCLTSTDINDPSGPYLLPANDSGKGSQHAIRLANDVWGVLRRLQSLDRFVSSISVRNLC